jgi:hypothetical protein
LERLIDGARVLFISPSQGREMGNMIVRKVTPRRYALNSGRGVLRGVDLLREFDCRIRVFTGSGIQSRAFSVARLVRLAIGSAEALTASIPEPSRTPAGGVCRFIVDSGFSVGFGSGGRFDPPDPRSAFWAPRERDQGRELDSVPRRARANIAGMIAAVPAVLDGSLGRLARRDRRDDFRASVRHGSGTPAGRGGAAHWVAVVDKRPPTMGGRSLLGRLWVGGALGIVGVGRTGAYLGHALGEESPCSVPGGRSSWGYGFVPVI